MLYLYGFGCAGVNEGEREEGRERKGWLCVCAYEREGGTEGGREGDGGGRGRK